MIFHLKKNSFLKNSPPKVSKPPAAYPFFPEGSLITDWYKGQINAAIEQARSSDVTFVMYYAPWGFRHERFTTDTSGSI